LIISLILLLSDGHDVFSRRQETTFMQKLTRYRTEPGYDDISYCDSSYIASDVLYQLISHC